MEENSAAAAIALAPENLVTIERAMPQEAISGDRYAADALALVNG